MLLAARLLILSAIVLTGCRTAKKAAVSTFRVIDAPARYVRDRIDPDDGTTVTTTTTTQTSPNGVSDVVTPGRPIAPGTAPRSATSTPPRTATGSRPSPSPRTSVQSTRADTAPTTQPQPSVATSQPTPAPASDLPTARPVPGKPGFVFITDSTRMIDVTGYKSGDKAKDPYTHQIFIVP